MPKQALIYEGDQVRVWVARAEDKTIELRQIKPGLINGDLVEVAGNLKPGEQIVTKGSLFIDGSHISHDLRQADVVEIGLSKEVLWAVV